MDADEYCARRAQATRSSLFYASLFSDREARSDLNALLALGAELEAVADQVTDAGVAGMKLQWWRDEILRTLDDGGQHPIAPALARLARRHDVPAEHFMAMTDAVEMALQPTAVPDMAALSTYLYRAGGAPSVIAARTLGGRGSAVERYAERLGMALRLIEIVRSVRADAGRGRIYLPQDRMTAHGVPPADLVANRTSPALAGLLAELSARARTFHERALDLLPDAERPRQRTGLIAARLYLDLLARIERGGYRVVEQRFALHPARKLWLAWRTARRAGRIRTRGGAPLN